MNDTISEPGSPAAEGASGKSADSGETGTPSETGTPTETETPTEAGTTATMAKRPFALARGTRLRYGGREGRVTAVRGNGEKPYEVCVIWDGEKYPQYYQYSALALAYDNGQLELL